MLHAGAAGTETARRYLASREAQLEALHDFFCSGPSPARCTSSRWQTRSEAPQPSSAGPRCRGHLRRSPMLVPAGATSLFSRNSPHVRPPSQRRPTPSAPPPPPPLFVSTAPRPRVKTESSASSTSAAAAAVPELLPSISNATTFAAPHTARSPSLAARDVIWLPPEQSVAANARAAFPLPRKSPSDRVVARPTLQSRRTEADALVSRLESACASRLAVAHRLRAKDLHDPDYDPCEDGDRALLTIARPVKEDELVPCRPVEDFGSNLSQIMHTFFGTEEGTNKSKTGMEGKEGAPAVSMRRQVNDHPRLIRRT